MIGKHHRQKVLFSYHVDLGKLIRHDHPLRQIEGLVDCNFAKQPRLQQLYSLVSRSEPRFRKR
jgi:hypothetical protein